MDLDFGWLSLADAVGRLVAPGVQEAKAEADICDAIAEKRLRLRVYTGDGNDGRLQPTVHEFADVDIPVELNLNRLDWAHSRPAVLHPWRIRSTESVDEWQARDVILIEASVEDFVVELCDDVSSVRLSDNHWVGSHPLSSAGRVRDLQEFARAKWWPCQAAADALRNLTGRETISLSEAISIMALDSHAESSAGGKREYALRRQAGRTLCDAAWLSKVVLSGSRSSQETEVKQIPEDYFEIPRCLASSPNSVERDHERSNAPSSRIDQIRSSFGDDEPMLGGSEALGGLRFNVEVDVGSFLGWLNHEISVERERQLRRRRSQRLFEYPFWSIETALCWIAFRDADCLETRKDETEKLLRCPERGARRANRMVESQPEIRLLGALRDRKLKALEGVRALPKHFWANCVPKAGGLSLASQSLRLAREEMLRTFPAKTRCSAADGQNNPQPTIGEIVEWMRRTRRWISCAEIADWCAGGVAHTRDFKSRRSHTFDRLRANFAAGAFHLAGRSQLRLLSPDTSVVRLFCEPVDRTVDADGFRDTSVPNYFERCWLPNETCRRWFKQQELDWPDHFEKKPRAANNQLTAVQAPEAEIQRKRGRPSLVEPYAEEFERILQSQALRKTQKEEVNGLKEWGENNLSKEKRVKHGVLEKLIRNQVKIWGARSLGKQIEFSNLVAPFPNLLPLFWQCSEVAKVSRSWRFAAGERVETRDDGSISGANQLHGRRGVRRDGTRPHQTLRVDQAEKSCGSEGGRSDFDRRAIARFRGRRRTGSRRSI
jgi:hypothetical protein